MVDECTKIGDAIVDFNVFENSARQKRDTEQTYLISKTLPGTPTLQAVHVRVMQPWCMWACHADPF